MTGESASPSFFTKVKDSIYYSAGEIVFGMEDGVVSIFGLVLGVAVSAQSGSVVFLAGATGAIAATVSMMAGLYLDLESEEDEERVAAEERDAEIRADPTGEVSKLIGTLQGTGLSTKSLEAIEADLQANPLAIRKVEDAVCCEEEPLSKKVPPLVHATWMGIADFIAGIIPVLPFAFFPLGDARYICIGVTAVILVLMGIGRAKIGKRPMGRTVLETIAIATAAAIAGVLVGLLLS